MGFRVNIAIIDPLLRTNQNGFRKGRSTSAQILALRRLVGEARNGKNMMFLLFIDFSKAFDSVDREEMFKIIAAYGVPEKIVNSICVMYQDTSVVVLTPDGTTESFTVSAGVQQGDTLAAFLFIIVLDYVLRHALNSHDGVTIVPRKSRRHPAVKISDLNYADDFAITSDSLSNIQDMLLRIEATAAKVGLCLNAKKTKFMQINKNTSSTIKSADGRQIEMVDDFKYFGSYINTEKDMSCRIGMGWTAAHKLEKLWKSPLCRKTKVNLSKATVESILLYGCESWAMSESATRKLDGCYTKLLRLVLDVNWQQHIRNSTLYGDLEKISDVVRSRRLGLFGHVLRHPEEAANSVVTWKASVRRVGRPYLNTLTLLTVLDVVCRDTGLLRSELKNAAQDRAMWSKL